MKKYVNSFLFVCLLFGITSSVSAYTFTRTLTIGSSGQDVHELQKILNQNPLTQLGVTGVGSPGQETFYFGELTRQAVIRFQNKYAPQILHPINLTAGTGFVGTKTIEFLNSQNFTSQAEISSQTDEQTEINTQTAQSITTSAPINMQSTTSNPHFVISPTILRPGDTLYIASEHSLTNTQFTLNNASLTSRCRTEYVCEIRLPNQISASHQYVIASDNLQLGTAIIQVIQEANAKPTSNIRTLSLSKDNIITGQNFTPRMNIYTPHGQFTTQTLNNSFILSFPQNISYEEGVGILILENENGLQSDIIFVQYEK